MPGVVALLAVLLAALYVCWLVCQPFLNAMLWAGVPAVVCYPRHRRISSGRITSRADPFPFTRFSVSPFPRCA